MSGTGSGGNGKRFGWGAGRRTPKPGPSPSPAPRPRPAWRPKGSPQTPGSPLSGATPGASPPRRNAPPSRGTGPRTTRTSRPAGRGDADKQGAAGQTADGTAAGKAGGKNGQRRLLPGQLVPGRTNKADGEQTDPQGNGPEQPTRSGWSVPGTYTAVDYFMAIPGFAVAWYGGQLIRDCAAETRGMVAFALWLIIAFWVTLATARWPTLRMLRWAWVLAGVLGAVWTPG